MDELKVPTMLSPDNLQLVRDLYPHLLQKHFIITLCDLAPGVVAISERVFPSAFHPPHQGIVARDIFQCSFGKGWGLRKFTLGHALKKRTLVPVERSTDALREISQTLYEARVHAEHDVGIAKDFAFSLRKIFLRQLLTPQREVKSIDRVKEAWGELLCDRLLDSFATDLAGEIAREIDATILRDILGNVAFRKKRPRRHKSNRLKV